MDQRKVGNFIKKLRKEQTLTQEQMAENIDAKGGAGTAEFVAKAIEAYCKK